MSPLKSYIFSKYYKNITIAYIINNNHHIILLLIISYTMVKYSRVFPAKSKDFEFVSKYQKLAAGSFMTFECLDTEYAQPDIQFRKSRTIRASKLIKLLTFKKTKRLDEENFDLYERYDYTKHEKFIIKCDSKPKILFNIFMNILVIYSVIQSLFLLAFGVMDKTQTIFEIFVWLMFIIELILTFFTEFVDEKGKSIKNFRIIAIKYAKTWFLFDFLAILPLGYTGNPNTEYFLRMSRLFKMNRLFYMIDVRNVTNYLRMNSKTISKKQRILYLIIEKSWDLIIEICSIMFFCYFLSCLWWYYVNLLRDYRKVHYNFVDFYGLNDFNTSHQLIVCMYFIFTTLMTVGYGDYSARNSYEMGFCIFIMLIGSAWLALTISRVISFVKELEKIGEVKDNLNDLVVFINNLENIHGVMPSLLKKKVLAHFNYYWKHDRLGRLANPDWTRDIHGLLEISDETLKFLPKKLQQNTLDYLFKDYFNNFTRFFGTEDEFRYDICLHMQPRFYDNEYILIQGDFCQELLLMQKGFALMGFHDENDNFVICQNFSSGIIIGESSVFLKMPSFASYKAYGVEAMAIPDHAVTKILREKYPTRMLNYMDIVRNRTASLMASVEGHEGYIKTDTRHKLMWQMSIKSAEDERFISHNKRLKDIYKKFKEMKKQLKEMHDDILIIKGPE